MNVKPNIYLTLILLIAIISSCDFEKPIEPAFLDTLEKAKLEDEESLSRTLNSVSTIQANKRTASVDYGTLDLEKIFKRIESEEQEYANYMIRLYPPDGVQNSLEYLVMIGTDYGFRAYILQYQTTPEHINSINDPTIYTGYINILDMERKLLAKNYFENGEESENSNPANRQNSSSGCNCTYTVEDEEAGSHVLGDDWPTGNFTIVIECQCLGDPGSDNGSGSIGDPLYDPSNPDAGGGSGSGSGSGNGEPGGITRDPVGAEKEVDCVGDYIKNSDGLCIPKEEYIIGEIEKKLEFNPYALLEIDCDQITKWQELAQHDAPNDIKNKINALQSQNDDWFDDWAIQSLNGANGTIVNMDYFSVNVTDMPTNPSTGNEFTPEGFLDYFRRNINEFADGSTFEPYCEVQSICTQETNLWNSSDPTGAIIYIDIPGDDGAVICSEYELDYWKFMTLEAPGAGNHPVSGTRQFGFETVPSRSGPSYNFFVRGVDRFDSNIVENALYMRSLVTSADDDSFFGADALWESFQSKMSQFINNNGGNASINTPVKNRPDWEEVMEVLEGKRPISDLGCN